MLLGQLIEMQKAGTFNIKYEAGSPVALVGGVEINTDQAHGICRQLGWEGYVLHPFEIINKTNKFIKGIRQSIDNEYLLGSTEVVFRNIQSSTYGRTYDRIHMIVGNTPGFSIIYNMPGNASVYTIFDSATSVAVAKCRNLKKVGEYINSVG